MSLFKIFRGPEERLNAQPLHEGYAWFTEDKHNLYIDVSEEPGGRVQVNAYAADVLLQKDESGEVLKEINVDDLLLSDTAVSVAQGGTGLTTLTVNALLVGNGTDPIKLIPLTGNGVLVSDVTDGAKELTGAGALFASAADNIPQFGTLPIEAGGTGGATAAAARTKLSIYSKSEVDNAIEAATAVAYSATLAANGWTAEGDIYVYQYNNVNLSCGKAHNVPPIITYTSNHEEYSKLSGEATPEIGIQFTSPSQPTADIGIIIIDVK